MTYKDPLIEYCKAHGLKLDRETYIAGCYPDGTPDPWTAEHEEQLPPEFRWSGKGVPPPEFSGYSLAQWAAYFAADDAARIDGAVRGGVLSGLDSTEIGRKVVGSTDLRGMDGQTEITRRKIARLGAAEIKARNLRKNKNER